MGLELKSLTRDAVLESTAQQLGLSNEATTSGELTVALIAGILRRVAVTTCPCPRSALVSCAIAALTGFGTAEAVKSCVGEVLDRLIVIGDLLELGGSMSLPDVMPEDWLYCAPPTFVVQDGSILLLGIEPEDHASLPGSLRTRVVRQRELRYIRPYDASDRDGIAVQLRVARYLEISKAAWTRLPQNQTANSFLDGVVRRLNEADNRGALEGLQVYVPADPKRRFASRLEPPAERSGFYVGRRPQAFGAPIWVFVELDEGRPVRFLDLPWQGGRFRGCDHGWRILSALDALAGQPQIYRATQINEGFDRYEFFSPLPLWVERRLRIHGEKISVEGALFAYEIDRHCDHNIDDLVQSYMWFKKID